MVFVEQYSINIRHVTATSTGNLVYEFKVQVECIMAHDRVPFHKIVSELENRDVSANIIITDPGT